MRNKITLSKALFFFSLSFITGIFFAPSSILLGFLFVFFLYVFLAKGKEEYFSVEISRNSSYLVFCLLFFFLGVFSFYYSNYNIPKEIETPVSGRVVEKPSFRGNYQRLLFEHEEGKALLYVDKYEKYNYGDILMVEGNFIVPSIESYANYLKKEGVYHTVFNPNIEKKGNKKNFFYAKSFRLKERAEKNIQQSIPVPESFLLEAMVLGDRSSFTDEFSEKLSISGTRHITAISGMHIVIISGLLFYFFLLIKVKKTIAVFLTLGIIAGFVFFVGAPASAVRAGIMGGVFLLSQITKREKTSFRLIVFTATIMLLFNPLLLHFDLGFQLSFLAVLGIFSFHSHIKKWLERDFSNKKKDKKSKIETFFAEISKKRRKFFLKNSVISDLLAVTLSAQIAVFPLILYNFGHISLLSVPANLLIVPLLPIILPLGILIAITGSFLFSFPCIIILSFVVFVINFFSSFYFSAIYIENFPLFLLLLVYIFLFKKAYKIKQNNLQNLYR